MTDIEEVIADRQKVDDKELRMPGRTSASDSRPPILRIPPGRGEVSENRSYQISACPSGSIPVTTPAKRANRSQITGCGPPAISP